MSSTLEAHMQLLRTCSYPYCVIWIRREFCKYDLCTDLIGARVVLVPSDPGPDHVLTKAQKAG